MASTELEASRARAVARVGRTIAEYRTQFGQVVTQEKLAEEFHVSRTTIAHLEEGQKLVDSDLLSRICDRLGIPDQQWIAATHRFYMEGFVFHELLCELTGRRTSIVEHAATDQLVAIDRIEQLFTSKLSPSQAHAQFNSVLIFYGERPITRAFFDRYLGVDAFADNESFLRRLRAYQADAMRLYGNFRRAFTRMSRVLDLEAELEPLRHKSLDGYRSRSQFAGVQEIPTNRLKLLGYIAVQKLERENQERSEISESLRGLASEIEKGVGGAAQLNTSPKRLRRLRTLLRRFESPIQLEEGLFVRLEPELLKAEATRIAPEEEDLVRIGETQRTGLKNLGVYLSEPYMDVYVATSMREEADFQSVNAFVQQLFKLPSVEELNLRYFNPTQSWIEDRVAKGLVEALMLRRAAVTVYMAQKGDTFGKDSEASVALGQGKTVIVYVPRLHDEENGIDSERVFRLDPSRLDQQLSRAGLGDEESIDTREKAKLLLRRQLTQLTPDQFKRLVLKHWADFDLGGEASRIENKNLRSAAVKFIEAIAVLSDDAEIDTIAIDDTTRFELVDRLVSTAERFESRASTFRDIHPLSLQVIVRSGVLNGILVTRSVEDCGRLLRAVIENAVEVEVIADDNNYRLAEKRTGSTLRVVSRHRLLTFAFWSQYFEEGATSSSLTEVPAAPL